MNRATVPKVAYVVYAEGAYPDTLFQKIIGDLRKSDIQLAGIIQHDVGRNDRSRCDMFLEDLSSGRIIGLSEDRGPSARDCRIDESALISAVSFVEEVLKNGKIKFLLINKFGKIECAGRGFRDTISKAYSDGIPVLVGIPSRNIDSWNEFIGDCAINLNIEYYSVMEWISQVLKSHVKNIELI